MIIGIDASKAAEKQKTGIENLTYQLIFNLKQIDQNNQYRLYTPFPLDKQLLSEANFKQNLIPFVKFWNKVRLPLELLKHQPDAFLMPGYIIPSFAPKNTAVIIHDLAYKYFPEAYSKKDLLLQEMAAKKAAKKAKKIIFPSASAHDDFIKFYGISDKKCSIVPLGYDQKFKLISKPKDVLKLNAPYILSVGRLEARKNIVALIKAFKIFREQGKLNHKLVLVGKPGYKYDKIKQEIEKLGPLKNEVILAGYVPEKNIVDLYAKAEMFVYPSLYEGFGMTVLESFACGTPVITSDSSALPEVAGEAALYVNPQDETTIAKAMTQVSTDPKLKSRLIESGFLRLKLFSWRKFAENVLSVLESM